jgi:hypothetical protein
MKPRRQRHATLGPGVDPSRRDLAVAGKPLHLDRVHAIQAPAPAASAGRQLNTLALTVVTLSSAIGGVCVNMFPSPAETS